MEHPQRLACFLSFLTATIEKIYIGVLGCLDVSGGSDVSIFALALC